jgi:hypothetical protein
MISHIRHVQHSILPAVNSVSALSYYRLQTWAGVNAEEESQVPAGWKAVPNVQQVGSAVNQGVPLNPEPLVWPCLLDGSGFALTAETSHAITVTGATLGMRNCTAEETLYGRTYDDWASLGVEGVKPDSAPETMPVGPLRNREKRRLYYVSLSASTGPPERRRDPHPWITKCVEH